MAWQRFHNRTNVPINLCFTSAGMLYNDVDGSPMRKNNVKIYDEFFSPGVGYDLHVYYDTPQTRIEPSSWNPAAITNVVSISVGALAVVVGIVAIPLSAGASGALAAVGMGLAIGGGSLGVISTVGGVTAAALATPSNVVGLYGANDHNYYIDGGLEGHIDSEKKVVIDKVKPLTVSYINCQSGQKYEFGGYTVPE